MWITPNGTKYADKSDAMFHALLHSKAAKQRAIELTKPQLNQVYTQLLGWIAEQCDRGRPCALADEFLMLAGIHETHE